MEHKEKEKKERNNEELKYTPIEKKNTKALFTKI